MTIQVSEYDKPKGQKIRHKRVQNKESRPLKIILRIQAEDPIILEQKWSNNHKDKVGNII